MDQHFTKQILFQKRGPVNHILTLVNSRFSIYELSAHTLSLPVPLLRNGVLSHDSFRHLVRYKKAAEVIFNTPLILLTDRGETISVGSKCASDLYSEGVLNVDEADEERDSTVKE